MMTQLDNINTIDYLNNLFKELEDYNVNVSDLRFKLNSIIDEYEENKLKDNSNNNFLLFENAENILLKQFNNIDKRKEIISKYYLLVLKKVIKDYQK